MQSPKSGESDCPKPTESSRKQVSQGLRDSLKAIDSSALHRRGSGPVLGSEQPIPQVSSPTYFMSVRSQYNPRSHPRLRQTSSRRSPAESPLVLVGHEPWLTELAGLLTIGRAESLFRLKKGGLIWLQGAPEVAGMLTKIVLAPATTLKLLDTQGELTPRLCYASIIRARTWGN